MAAATAPPILFADDSDSTTTPVPLTSSKLSSRSSTGSIGTRYSRSHGGNAWTPPGSPGRKIRSEYQLRLRSAGKRRMSLDSRVSEPYKRCNSPVLLRREGSCSDETYSDRFIPSRRESQMDITFSLIPSPRGACHTLPNRSFSSSDSSNHNSSNTSSEPWHTHAQQVEPVGGQGQSLEYPAGSFGAPTPSTPSNTNNTSDGSKEGQNLLNMLLKSELLGVNSFPPRHHRQHSENNCSSRGGGHARDSSPQSNLLCFKDTSAQQCADEFPDNLPIPPIGAATRSWLATPRKHKRKIAKVPFKVLDAPALQDDFYLNLVDWSSLNVLAVGLGSCVYLWSACTSMVTKLCDLGPEDCVTSVSWTPRGTHLAVGTNLGEVQIWDTCKCKKVRTMAGHSARIGTMAWNAQVLASGSRDRLIYMRDMRVREPYISKLQGHKQEVCGLRWSFDDNQLASGGNDNKLYIWNLHASSPVQRFCDHTAAVKAIAWSPHQHGLLASGGGTADRCIRFWNTLNGAALNCIDTGSQVCNLLWSKNSNEIVSTHGYSLNQIIVWRYPSMAKVATLTGHTYRVLYLAASPDGQTIVTGAGDETLRFWNALPGAKSSNGSRVGASLILPLGADIR